MPQLYSESLSLSLARRIIVVVIEPHLAPADDLRMAGKLKQARFEIIVEQPRFMRVKAHGGVYKRVALGQAKSRRVRIFRYVAIAYGDYHLNARRAGARDHLFAVGVKVLHLYVRVRVYVHGRFPKRIIA